MPSMGRIEDAKVVSIWVNVRRGVTTFTASQQDGRDNDYCRYRFHTQASEQSDAVAAFRVLKLAE